MEKLILKCGRYIPTVDDDTGGRIKDMEAYLSRLTDELEHLLSELNLAVQELMAAREEGGYGDT